MVDHLTNMVRVAEAGNKDAIGAGGHIGLAAFERIAQSFCGRDAGLPISVRTGVDDQMDFQGVGGAARGLYAGDLLGERKERASGVLSGLRVFKVHAHGASFNDLRNGSFPVPERWRQSQIRYRR